MTKDEALDLALEFVEANHFGGQDAFELITAIKQALAAPVRAPAYEGEPDMHKYASRLEKRTFEMQALIDQLDFELRTARATPPAAQPASVQEVRLWDTQWTNVVNHDNAYSGWDKQDAINHAVKMTEQYIAKNVRENKCPPAAHTQEPVECQYGNGGYACCEGGPCKAEEQNNVAEQPAPDLLNALKRILDEPNNTMSDGKALKEIIRIARDAITKATGEKL